MGPALAQMAVVGLALAFFSTDSLTRSDNRVANEIGANGAMSFFRAARTSELPYTAYYATRDSRKNFRVLTSHLARTGGRLTALGHGRLNRRFAADPRGLGTLNVIVVAEESFGAEFSATKVSPTGAASCAGTATTRTSSTAATATSTT
jgi:hypothetical protein